MAPELAEALCKQVSKLPARQMQISFELCQSMGPAAFETEAFDDDHPLQRREIVEKVPIGTNGEQIVVDLGAEVDRLRLISQRHGIHTPLSRR